MNRLLKILEMDIPHNKIGLAHFTDSLTAAGTETAHIETISMMPTDGLKDFFGERQDVEWALS